MKHEFTLRSFSLRTLLAILLVLVTINPSGYSYYHWVIRPGSGTPYLELIAGLILLAGWVIYVRAAKNSLGLKGALLVGVVFVVLIWVLIEFSPLRANSGTAIAWLAELVLAGVLAIGISWPHIRRRLRKQQDTNENES